MRVAEARQMEIVHREASPFVSDGCELGLIDQVVQESFLSELIGSTALTTALLMAVKVSSSMLSLAFSAPK